MKEPVWLVMALVVCLALERGWAVGSRFEVPSLGN